MSDPGAGRADQGGHFANKVAGELFPTLFWVFDLRPDDAEACSRSVMAYLDQVASPRPKPKNDLSLQTDHAFQRHPAFAPLQPHVEAAVGDVIGFLRLEPAPFIVTGAWVNVSAPGIRHHEHAHPNNLLSLVYYVRTPKGGDTIRFYDPRPQAHVIAPRPRAPSMHTASSITIDVKPGRLVAFPAWLRHSVDANAGEGERVSVALNVMFREFGEKLAAPMWEPKIKG